MSDRSDETGPAPETPSGQSDAAHGETAPESARHENPPPAPARDTDPADDTGNPDDTITLPADAVTARPTEETTPPPSDDSAGLPTDHRDAPAIDEPEATALEASETEATAPTTGETGTTAALATGDRETVEPETTALPTGNAPDSDDATRVQPAVAATEPAFQGAAVAADRAEQSAGPLQHTAVFDRPGGTPFLAASGLTASGRQGPIFTDITVHANLGQLVAICGDGGEGRSSLLLALTGRFPFRSGELEVDGQAKPGQIRRRFTIAQAGPPIRFEPYATVGACIKETTTVSKGTATRANINAWLDRLAVGVDTGDTFGFLPRIDQIRFAIACAAASRTPAIAVDDADTGLDRCGSERVFEALRTVADAGQLVLAVSTRSDPPADTVVDLRAQPAPDASALHESDRNGGHR